MKRTYTKKPSERMDRMVAFTLTIDDFERLLRHCARIGESRSGFMRRLVREELDKSARQAN